MSDMEDNEMEMHNEAHGGGGGGQSGGGYSDGYAADPPPPTTNAPPPQYPGGRGAGFNQFRNAAAGNYDVAKQRAAERLAAEKEAAMRAKDQAVHLAHESKDALKQTADLAQDVAENAQDLPPAALAGVAKENMSRVHGQYAANMATINRNREALAATQAEAQKRMTELQGAGRQALETAVAVTVDIARGEFEARCAKVLEQEGKLAQMAQEIERREKQLSLLRSRGEPNWPCRADCCCCGAWIHHDIAGDIPRGRQGFVKGAYTNWFYTVFLLLANFSMALTLMFLEDRPDNSLGNDEKKSKQSSQIQQLVVSVVMLSGIPFSFIIWYWSSYKAVGTGSSGQYFQAKAGCWIAMFFNVFVVIGPVGYGGCGILYSIFYAQPMKGQNAFIACIVLAVLFGLQIFIFIWMLVRLSRFGKEDKASLAKAKLEYMGSEIRSSIGI
jgi:hypothetical protein